MTEKKQDETGPPPGDRVTVNLTGKASGALATAMHLTGDSKTTVINRAVAFYELAVSANAAGGGVYVQARQGAETEKLVLL